MELSTVLDLVWFLLAAILFLREKKRNNRFFLPILFVGFGSWVISELILKPLVARPRPTDLIGGFSFPSTHAVIAWAMATTLSSYEPRYRWWFYLLAAAISFSRVYLGVHYWTDVLGGALIGFAIGFVATNMLLPRLSAKRQRFGKTSSKRKR